jgi:hypothetical protein
LQNDASLGWEGDLSGNYFRSLSRAKAANRDAGYLNTGENPAGKPDLIAQYDNDYKDESESKSQQHGCEQLLHKRSWVGKGKRTSCFHVEDYTIPI